MGQRATDWFGALGSLVVLAAATACPPGPHAPVRGGPEPVPRPGADAGLVVHRPAGGPDARPLPFDAGTPGEEVGRSAVPETPDGGQGPSGDGATALAPAEAGGGDPGAADVADRGPGPVAPPPVAPAVVRQGIAFRRVPAGTFDQGSPEDEPGRIPLEAQRRVTLSRDFEIAVTEVTQAQYEAVAGANPSMHPGCADCPVEWLSWYDAARFTNLLSEREGLDPCYDCSMDGDRPVCAARSTYRPPSRCPGYRLPTRAEWEYAARAGTATAFSAGPITNPIVLADEGCGADPVMERVGWYCANAGDGPRPVAGKEPNAWGLYDMHGNVAEWTADAEPPPTVALDAVDPFHLSGYTFYLCGGSWYHAPRDCRSAAFNSVPPYIESDFQGVRPVRTVPPEEAGSEGARGLAGSGG
jgi:formylglycine-generating enzyme required for sulfatase activity